MSEIQDVVTAGLYAVSFSRRFYVLVGPCVSFITLTKVKNNCSRETCCINNHIRNLFGAVLLVKSGIFQRCVFFRCV